MSLKSTLDCPACDGQGFQAGAHTEKVNDCPTCEGSGIVPAPAPNPHQAYVFRCSCGVRSLNPVDHDVRCRSRFYMR